MDTKFFYDPFATGGDRASVPDATQLDGSVSYQQGFGPDYSLDPESDPDALLLNRPQFNQIMYQATAAIGALQKDFPQWVSASDNGGSPLAYAAQTVVRYTDGVAYQSLVGSNTATPGTDPTKWTVFLSNYATAAALAAEVARATAAEATKAPFNSPNFTGTPTAPTPSPGTGGNLLATCAYVLGAVQSETNRASAALAAEVARATAAEAALAPIASPNFTGTPALAGLPLATQAYADAGVAAERARALAAEAALAPIASPNFSGTPRSSGQPLATQAYADAGVATERARALAAEASLAPINSPALTGVPTVPTPPGNSADATVPNTSWVQALIANLFSGNTPGFDPAVPGSFQWGAFILKWTFGPYDPGDNSEPYRNLPWDSAFPTGCLIAMVSTDLAFGGATMDAWYQTAGWDANGVNVQRQRPPQGSWTIPTRAVAIGIGR